jgi:hypothetical protein
MSASPISTPSALGFPCWTDESVAGTIRPIAQVDPGRASWFLACHAPILHLRETRTDSAMTEQDAYLKLSDAIDQEVQVFVKGEPGTGKSHFINWLKLRYDNAVSNGEIAHALPVLIQRRSGSLKDALDQLVNQLPSSFSRYIEPIKSAISRITEDQARERLCLFIKQALSDGSESRNRRLRALEETFASTGFRRWLCRPGGVIASNIERLISPSDVRERESVPQFTASDFSISDTTFRLANTPDVLDLIDTFDDEPHYRELAAESCNHVLRRALRDMTGLGNNQLTEIFRLIRADLKKLGQRLILFVEDVSTLSVLDEEIVNALEPQNDSSLCPLTSVTGMTFAAFERLRENQKQRATFIWSLGSSSNSDWRADPRQLDRFVARYLNTVRLRDSDIQIVGQQRLKGNDVTLSACSGCGQREKCHSTFGSVSFGDEAVGLFPLRPSTAFRVMEHLDETRDGIEKTQRGLLSYVLAPLLNDLRGRESGRAPILSLPVRSIEPAYWTGFQNDYCGNWRPDERRKARTLALFWTTAADKGDAAAELSALVDPFALPPLSRKVAASKPIQLPAPNVPRSPPSAPPAPRSSPEIPKLRARLERWLAGDPLTTPRDAQELLLTLLKNGLPFEECRIPARAARQLISDASVGIIRIEGAATRQATSHFAVEFARTDETAELVLALAGFKHDGAGSWDYSDGPIHRRTVSVWLRRHQSAILAKLDAVDATPARAVSAAAQFLALAATVVSKHQLPQDASEAFEQIIQLNVAAAPVALSARLRELYADLPQRVPHVVEFMLGEIDLPQGSGGTLFVDPHFFVRDFQRFRANELPEPLSEAYFAGFSQSRYEPLRFISESRWASLRQALEEERAAIAGLVTDISEQIRVEVGEHDDHRAAARDFLLKALELRKALAAARVTVHDPQFEALAPKLGIRVEAVASSISRALEVSSTDNPKDVLSFDTGAFVADADLIRTVVKYVASVRAQVKQAMVGQVTVEAVLGAKAAALEALESLEKAIAT